MGRFAEPSSNHAASPKVIPIGARCQIESRRGTIRFFGPTLFGKADGSDWAGVEYDEPVGKNNGT